MQGQGEEAADQEAKGLVSRSRWIILQYSCRLPSQTVSSLKVEMRAKPLDAHNYLSANALHL